ncbi:MAG: sulfatase-like hydrolase/transferase [Bacteroidota bacterium]
MIISRFKFLSVFCFTLISLFASSQKRMDRPNFIFILTDDQAYGLMGCTGNEVVRTPNLDRLASDGVLFTNAHVTSAICTPSRASILLSEFERKHHINFNSGTSMNLEAWESTYPMVMRSNGYYTGWIGKNHVPVGEGGYSSGVMDQSFDYWYAGHGHLSFYPKTRHDIFKNASENTQVEVLAEGVQDFLTNDQKLDGAKRFLDQRPTEQPFMLSVCLNLPHGAGTRSMEMKDTDDEIYKTLYRDQKIAMPDQYIAKDEIVTPKLPSDLLKVEDRQTIYDYVNTPETNREIMIRELQAMTGIDRMVGELMEKLKEENLLKNTVIIFSSDHGLYKGQHGLGGKALCYEQTTHVPLIIYDPRAKNTGVRSDELVQSIDIAPTILDMAGFQLPDSYQGKSLVRLLNQEVPRVREYLYTENLW